MLQVLRDPQRLRLLRVNGLLELFEPLIGVERYCVREQVRVESLQLESIIVQTLGAFGLEIFGILLSHLFRVIAIVGLEVDADGKVLSVVEMINGIGCDVEETVLILLYDGLDACQLNDARRRLAGGIVGIVRVRVGYLKFLGRLVFEFLASHVRQRAKYDYGTSEVGFLNKRRKNILDFFLQSLLWLNYNSLNCLNQKIKTNLL